ncbi:DMT family transporter [Fusibacter tunisiensis]|uniref:Uncharacterized membrane protein YdcZ (DUF606 family) n=1 Tax=Fusibacter tunisiensis TaxID=1008308 RepID=A0ABS2MTE2_9FIRM|nr:DMT family transporter [Fusibacter tunisiensis]MBM7562679.1 uncharacterized membrane protein YdcZ (DUF606 family) [Fusibacter tunisiensis]
MALVYLFAIFIGILVTVTPILNGRNTLAMGTFKASFNHYFTAFIFGILFLALLPGNALTALDVKVNPIYFAGGLLGLSVMLMMNYYSVRIRAMHIAILPFLGQMTMGFFLDYYLIGVLEIKVIIGMIIVLIGLYVQSSTSK